MITKMGSGIPKALFVAAFATGLLGLQSTSAAAQSLGPAAAPPGAVTQALAVPGGVAYITFQTLPSGSPGTAAAAANGYVVQYASVELCPPSGCSWHATVSGDWEYNGTYAYTYSGPDCSVTDPGPYSCNVYANGAQLPHNMTWKMAGTAYAGPWRGCTYSLAIYFWGNGGHNFSTSHCGF